MPTTDLTIARAQRDVRTAFAHGAAGQAVSGLIWLASAAAASAGRVRLAVLLVVVGGAFIFPLTRAALRLVGRTGTLGRGHPMNALAMQTAFIVPLLLPLAGAAALQELQWFYPAVMMIVGAHYLPFVFLYGMPAFAVLGGALLAGGFGLGWWRVGGFATGGWLGAALLLAFAVWAAAVEVRTARGDRGARAAADGHGSVGPA